jgi:hypothetical protein
VIFEKYSEIDDEELDERTIEKRNDIAAYYSEVIEKSDSE